ncbi:MAG: SOS response-associated peptidase, partial [Anaerolineae bacterium]|nr:SOS response-associated peptidase [Caldilineales bacterium]MDW8270316.1 SOS response-associated peptidase [Anaerolineae bacterium]
MCGRFTLTASGDELASLFDLEQAPNLEPRYNIAPTQPVAVVRLDREGRRREFTLMRWGLIPSWAKDIHIGNRLINARAETLTEKPAFRTAFRRRRCLIPANGFYEWQKPTAGRKQPYFIGLPDRRPFAFAGLWEHWEGADGSVLDSCAIITTAANERVRVLHDRMPVILERTDFGDWLDPTTTPDRLF